jgi:hypothetical protein
MSPTNWCPADIFYGYVRRLNQFLAKIQHCPIYDVWGCILIFPHFPRITNQISSHFRFNHPKRHHDGAINIAVELPVLAQTLDTMAVTFAILGFQPSFK